MLANWLKRERNKKISIKQDPAGIDCGVCFIPLAYRNITHPDQQSHAMDTVPHTSRSFRIVHDG